jgi:hypothetical protein
MTSRRANPTGRCGYLSLRASRDQPAWVTRQIRPSTESVM